MGAVGASEDEAVDLSLETYAGVVAAVDAGFDLDEVLVQEQVLNDVWSVAERRFKDRLTRDPELFQRYTELLSEAQDVQARRIPLLEEDLPAWVGLLGAVQRKDTTVEELGLTPKDMGRLQRHWDRRFNEDEQLRKHAEKLAADPPPDPPRAVSVEPPLLQPYRWTPDVPAPASRSTPFQPNAPAVPPPPAAADLDAHDWAGGTAMGKTMSPLAGPSFLKAAERREPSPRPSAHVSRPPASASPGSSPPRPSAYPPAAYGSAWPPAHPSYPPSAPPAPSSEPPRAVQSSLAPTVGPSRADLPPSGQGLPFRGSSRPPSPVASTLEPHAYLGETRATGSAPKPRPPRSGHSWLQNWSLEHFALVIADLERYPQRRSEVLLSWRIRDERTFDALTRHFRAQVEGSAHLRATWEALYRDARERRGPR